MSRRVGAASVCVIERRSRVHVEVWAHGEKLHILNRFWGATEEFLKASCYTFTTIGRCHNLDTQGQRATKEKCRTVESPRWKRRPRCATHELEAAVGRGRSKSGFITISGLGVWTRKTNFRWPQVELSTQLSTFVPRAARQLKVVGLSRGPPLLARIPKVSSCK